MTRPLLMKDAMTASPHSVGASVRLRDAAALMQAHQIRHLPVLEGNALVGLLSDRDVQLMRSVGDGDVTVEEAMSQAPYTVRPNVPLAEVAKHLSAHKLGSAVVVDANERVVGVFTVTDGMRVLAELLAPAPKAKTKTAAKPARARGRA